MAKYLQRGSVLEAIEQLHRARARVLQLWAAGEHVGYPVFGLTSLLDDADARLPNGIEATYPTSDRAGVIAASLATAMQLEKAGRHARADLDTPLRTYVTSRLRAVRA